MRKLTLDEEVGAIVFSFDKQEHRARIKALSVEVRNLIRENWWLQWLFAWAEISITNLKDIGFKKNI